MFEKIKPNTYANAPSHMMLPRKYTIVVWKMISAPNMHARAAWMLRASGSTNTARQ